MRLREESRNYVLTGLFVIGMIAVLVVWLAALSGRTGSVDRYTVRFDNVMGLAGGTEVRFEGFPVGRVESIEPSEDGDFRVRLAIERGWPVPEDSVVRIASSGLLSAVVLDVQRGRSERLLEPGAEIASRPPSDVFASVGTLADELARLVRDDVGPLTASLSESTPELVERLGRFAERLEAVGDQMSQVLDAENRERVDRILVHLDDGSARLPELARSLGDTRERLDDILVAIDGMLASGRPELESSLVDLRRTLEAAARHADAVSHNLEVSTRNLGELSGDVRRDPSLLLRGRDGAAPVEGER